MAGDDEDTNMFIRLASAVSGSGAITFLLLFVMQLLISLQPGATVEARERDFVDFVRVPLDPTPVQPIDNKIEKRELTNTELPPSRPNHEPGLPVTGVALTTPLPPSGNNARIQWTSLTDGPLVALVRVEPVYPAREQARGIEGYVIVEFDVSNSGTVEDARVVESSNSRFDSKAIEAAYRFRFKPRVLDGLAIRSLGVRNKFTFRIGECLSLPQGGGFRSGLNSRRAGPGAAARL